MRCDFGGCNEPSVCDQPSFFTAAHNLLDMDHLKYNLSDRAITLYNADPTHDRIDLDWARKNAVIIHYYGRNKPWKEEYRGILDVFYHEVANS